MQQKPSEELIEKAEIFSGAVVARDYLSRHIKEEGYVVPSGVPESLLMILGLLNSMVVQLETEEVRELLMREDVRIIAEVHDPNEEPED
ncbi:hypothetical protein [Rothia nasimurium]|uniref:hypothetical protein n=1 Tax=Rothia nasimurium TaxID=85336 RepID=UPI001F18E33D|nr:hypothetical protein [Rothia nasimurium]